MRGGATNAKLIKEKKITTRKIYYYDIYSLSSCGRHDTRYFVALFLA